MVFRGVDFNSAVRIYREQLNHLRFADDVVLIAKSSHEMRRILEELNAGGKQVGLGINA